MASKRGKRRHDCGGKVKHASLAAAWTAAKKIMRLKADPGKAGGYQCKHCGKFHWGHR